MTSLGLRGFAAAAVMAGMIAPVMAQVPAPAPSSSPSEQHAPESDDAVVATVNGQPIMRSEVLEVISGLPPQYQQVPIEVLIPEMAQQIAAVRLVAEKAYEAGLQSDPEVQARIKEEERRVVGDVWLQRELDRRMSDQAFQEAFADYLANNPPQEQVKARHILVESEDKARELIEQLTNGAEFEDLANANTTDPSGKQVGGDLGWFAQGQMVPAFDEAAFELDAGEFTIEPVKTPFGWHVILVEERRIPPQPTLQEIKPQLHEQLVQTLVPQIMAEVKQGADIQMMDVKGEMPSSREAAPADLIFGTVVDKPESQQ
ncbi:peptidylprolyl isomerase [Aurantimonas sp. 22II-16-19i]|uniref:peptidylprolyl isomerase n=1 Tax=Aurantimonas sp. 22II-16-19i TaxID=1317114 RepID=UPI0009F8029C|nr:peptidylprolyl isomerase [Aurantimonas sp. 22II-16-19i]ORE96982.1 putative peptidyl-prolyl isomerase (PpiC-like) protein [Aurantimonas sp. 22II-16-19i]